VKEGGWKGLLKEEPWYPKGMATLD